MNKKGPLVSVIMPAYNCELYVKAAIDSILNQTYQNFELLIADDSSIDNTKKIIDSYTDTRIRRFHNESNMGYLQASNKLFKECTGDFITFQDADDYSDFTRLEKLIAYLNTNSEVACVGSNVLKVDTENKHLKTTNFFLKDVEIRNAFLGYKIVFTGSALMVRKEVISTIGIYNEYFSRIGSEDIYWYSLILDKYKVANILDSLYYYRTNPNSVTSTHKNPKAFVGHDLIIFLYKRRLNNKVDYLKDNNWSRVDACANYLMAINKVKQSKAVGLFFFTKNAFKSPILFFSFYRDFLVNFLSYHKKGEQVVQ
jgi:glycosyltransferase involved in cell wall biosynthesis